MRKRGKILLSNFQYGTTAVRFKANHQNRIVGIYTLGWEKQTSTSYRWNGLTRGEKDIIVFQYTLKGRGEICIDQKKYLLNQGDAFFVNIPSNHIYYLPESSNEWEFIHLTLFGEEAMRSYESITNELGNVFYLDINEKPITLIFDLLKDISLENISDAYEASAKAYLFLMELHRFALDLTQRKTMPESIVKAVKFMENNYAKPLTLDDIVLVSDVSKYHFTRLFHKTMHVTPMQYLKKVRINQAIELLKNESLTVEEIARKVGYANGNYFSKVFKQALGVSPGQFRNSKTFSPIDYFISDH